MVLARKSRGLAQADPSLNAGIISATGMMYLRLLILVAIMNSALLLKSIYAFTLGERKNIRSVSLFLLLLGLATIAYGLALPHLG